MCGYACRSVVLFASALMPLVASYAQMPPPLYTPNVDLSNAAYARALARLPNNQIVVGSSDLKRVDGVNQNYLARLNSDGSLDNGWNPAPDGAVGAVWVDAAGTLYVGGSFAHIGGQARAGLARFTANGASRMEGLIPEPYTPFARRVLGAFEQQSVTTTATDVAEAVWRAANDVSDQLRFPAGPDAVALAQSASAKGRY